MPLFHLAGDESGPGGDSLQPAVHCIVYYSLNVGSAKRCNFGSFGYQRFKDGITAERSMPGKPSSPPWGRARDACPSGRLYHHARAIIRFSRSPAVTTARVWFIRAPFFRVGEVRRNSACPKQAACPPGKRRCAGTIRPVSHRHTDRPRQRAPAVLCQRGPPPRRISCRVRLGGLPPSSPNPGKRGR
jgi:hypothetical protein